MPKNKTILTNDQTDELIVHLKQIVLAFEVFNKLGITTDTTPGESMSRIPEDRKEEIKRVLEELGVV